MAALARQFGTRRGGEPPARSIDREGVDPDQRSGAPGSKRTIASTSVLRPAARGRHKPPILNGSEGVTPRRCCPATAARGRARVSSRPRRARAARADSASPRRRPPAGPIRGSGAAASVCRAGFRLELRLGAESREKRGQKQDSFHRPCILSSTSPAAPMHPARCPAGPPRVRCLRRRPTSSAAGPLAELRKVEIPGFGDAAPTTTRVRGEEVDHRGDAVRQVVPMLLHSLHGGRVPLLVRGAPPPLPSAPWRRPGAAQFAEPAHERRSRGVVFQTSPPPAHASPSHLTVMWPISIPRLR